MQTTHTQRLKLLGLAGLVFCMLGCARGCPSSRSPIHPNPNMDYQEKYEAQEESGFFYDGMTMRTPIEGTVARDGLTLVNNDRLAVAADPHKGDAAFHTGKNTAGEFLAALPVEETDALLARGAERFAIYCQPCHDKKGNGRGVLTERGGVPVPSLHEERLLAMRPGEVFDTVTHGKGLMPAYRYPVPPGDRWAIIAHVRTMQRERQAADMAWSGSAAGNR